MSFTEDRRFPSNADLPERIITAEGRIRALEDRTMSMSNALDHAVDKLMEHMTREEHDRVVLLTRINAVLLSVLGAIGLAALDFAVNYFGKG